MKKLMLCIATSVLAVGAANATDPMDLAKQANCLACHSLETKMVGPSFKEIAAKRKGEEGAEALLMEKVKKGSSGVYGPVPMPPNPLVKDEDLQVIVQYVLAL